jgi:hypothetical protein
MEVRWYEKWYDLLQLQFYLLCPALSVNDYLLFYVFFVKIPWSFSCQALLMESFFDTIVSMHALSMLTQA